MKNLILKLLLKIIRGIKGGLKVVILGRSSIQARVYRAKEGKWSNKVILNNKPKVKI
ncbi:MAG: hypothetical protein K9M44_00245 [Candidatus Pacebacteria bacterium]|nr:hypothetical protein [Candidatus Paceibacterota bacterium]